MQFLVALGIAAVLGAISGPLYRRGGAALIYLIGAVAATILAVTSLLSRTEPAEVSRAAVLVFTGLPIAAGAVAAHLVARDEERSLRRIAFSTMAALVGAAGAVLLSFYAGWIVV